MGSGCTDWRCVGSVDATCRTGVLVAAWMVRFHGLPDHCPHLIRCGTTGVAEIDLVVLLLYTIKFITLFLDEGVQFRDGWTFGGKRAEVHDLYSNTFVEMFQAHLCQGRGILLFLHLLKRSRSEEHTSELQSPV